MAGYEGAATLRHSVAHSLLPNSAPSMDVTDRVPFHRFNPSGLYACVPRQLFRSVQALHGRITRLCGLEGPRVGICRCTQRMAVARGVGHPVRVLLSYNLVRVYEVPSYISLCLVHVHLTTDSSFPPRYDNPCCMPSRWDLVHRRFCVCMMVPFPQRYRHELNPLCRYRVGQFPGCHTTPSACAFRVH